VAELTSNRHGPIDTLDAQIARQRARWSTPEPTPTTPDISNTSDTLQVKSASGRSQNDAPSILPPNGGSGKGGGS
jgi:hypothetical protein